MPHVPAGNITGVYYIVVAGLPWACSWQRLKDFARNQQPDGKCIEIDHAMVYPDSTDGWVRVKGRENFLKAFKHLNGGILDDRSLLADGRNETETQTLRDWTTAWSPTVSHRDRNGSSSSSHTYSSSSASQYSSPSTYSGSDVEWHYQTQQGSQGYPVSPTYPTTFQYYQPQSPVYDGPSSPIYASPISQYPVATTPSGVVYTTNIVAATQLYLPQQAYTYAVPYMNGSYSSNPTSPTSPPPPVVKTEARKIIITQLPHGTTSSALHELLTKIVSNSKRLSHYSSAAVQSIEIATHVDGKAKGHAFAIFETHTVAKTVIRALDGMRFQGRVLSARFAKEGAEPARYSSVMSEKQAVVSSAELFQAQDSASGQWWGHGNETNGTTKMECKTKGDSGRESASKSPRSSKEADEKDEVVVNSEVKKSRGMSAPVVVDGSSSRGSHGREKKHRS